MRMRVLTAWIAAALPLAGPAAAHTSYMLPSTFDATNADMVTVQSSFTEDFFAPAIAVGDADFHVIAPDGTRAEFAIIAPFRQLVVMEAALPQDGTYRVTTGERLGRTSYEALVGEEWVVLDGPDAPLPEGATRFYTIQTATVADAYVSKGPLTRGAVDAPVGRLAIRPVTHPNDVFAGEDFVFDLTLGDAPLGGHELTLYRDGGEYEEPGFARPVVTDAEGRATVRFDRPGVYLVMTRHRAPAPDGADTDIRSYTTSLTLEVLP